MLGPFGITGEVKIAPTRVGQDALRDGLAAMLRVLDGDAVRSVRIVRVRRHKNGFVAKLEGVESANDAEALAGARIEISREAVVLADGEYFDDDLIGCEVREANRTLGVVTGVLHYPAQDVLQLAGGALVPLVGAFVREIDVRGRVVNVELPPGLVDGEPESA